MMSAALGALVCWLMVVGIRGDAAQAPGEAKTTMQGVYTAV